MLRGDYWMNIKHDYIHLAGENSSVIFGENLNVIDTSRVSFF